jgi:hypothetical protein
MGLAGRGATNAQRTLAGEGTVTILRVTSNVNLLKLASMRMVAAPYGLAAGPMAVFESVGIDADFFPEAACAQYLSSISVSSVTTWRRSPSGLRQDAPAFNGNRGQQSFFVSEVPVRHVSRHVDGPNFAQRDCLQGHRRQGAPRRDDQAILRQRSAFQLGSEARQSGARHLPVLTRAVLDAGDHYALLQHLGLANATPLGRAAPGRHLQMDR